MFLTHWRSDGDQQPGKLVKYTFGSGKLWQAEMYQQLEIIVDQSHLIFHGKGFVKHALAQKFDKDVPHHGWDLWQIVLRQISSDKELIQSWIDWWRDFCSSHCFHEIHDYRIPKEIFFCKSKMSGY